MVQDLIIYFGIVFGLSIIFSIFMRVTGGRQSKYINLAVLAFFFPAIAVLVMAVGFQSPLSNAGWGRFSLGWLLAALFIFPLAIHLITLPVQAFINKMRLPWLDGLKPAEDGLYHMTGTIKWGVITKRQLVYRLLQNPLIGVALVSFFAFFEVIGWRAWMLPRLLNLFDMRMGVLISAIIWSAWHIPFVFGGIQKIEGVTTWIMVTVYPLGLVGAGIVLGWLWIESQSIWIVTLAHGALNNWGQYAFKFMKEASEDAPGVHENVVLLTAVNLTLLVLGLIIFSFI